MKRKIGFLITCLFGILIFLQHHYVFMYFDDFGYASLSYGWTGNNAGMAYTLWDIFKFLEWHYFNWGGRILYFFFEIITFKIGGVELIQIVQATIIAMICILSGKIVAFSTNSSNYIIISLLFMLYGTLHLETLRDGVYWYSASVAYIWPLLPLLGSIYVYLLLEKKETSFRKWLMIFLVFLSSFSQEQTAVLVIVYIFSLIFFQYFFGEKRNNKRYIPSYFVGIGMSAVLGSMITILAPGNFVRAEAEIYSEFYNQNIFIRLSDNIIRIININIGPYNWIFVLIMTLICGTAIALYFKNQKLFIPIIIFVVYLIAERLIPTRLTFGLVMRAVWILYFFSAIVIYYYKQKNYLFLSMFIAGISSQGMMIVSPAISTRCHIMMEFVLHIILAECIITTLKIINQKKIVCIYYIGIGVVFIYSFWNFSNIIIGYKQNSEINQINNYKLLEAQKRNAAGYEIREIKLYKLYDDIYANDMPYHHKFIEVWMKKYYELPNSSNFLWINIEDDCIVSGEYYDDH